MRSDGHLHGHMNGHRSGHVHRAIAYGLVSLAGLLACVIMLRAYGEAAGLDETTRYLEASVSTFP
jgi:hypothetical protein